MAYQVIIKKAYQSNPWNGADENWMDDIADFEDERLNLALAEFIYAVDDHPTKKVSLKYSPNKSSK